MKSSIHVLRQRGNNDQAILDWLHLQELNLLPGVIRTETLRELWGCSQPQVSRRMSAIGELGCCCVRSSWGRYVIRLEPPKVKPKRARRGQGPRPRAHANTRERWEAMRQQLRARWQEVTA